MAQSRPPWLKLATRRDPQLQPVAQPARPIPTFSFLFGQASAPSKPAGPAPPSSAPPPAPAQIPGPSPTDPAPAPVASPPSPALRTTAPAPAPVASPPSPALRTTAPAPAPPPPEPEPAPPVQTAEVPISSIVSPWPPAVELPPLTLPPPSAEASLVPLPIPPPAPSPVVAPTPPPPELAAVPTPPAPSPVVAPTPPPPELAAVPTPPPPEAPELAPPATSAPLPTATTESPALPPVPAPAPPTTEGAPTLLPLSKEPQPLPQTEISQPPPPPTNQQTPAATGPPSPPSPPTSQPPRAAQPPPPPSSSPSAIPSPSPSPPAPSQRQQTLPPQLQSSQPTQAHHQPEPAPSPPLVELEPVPVLPPTRLHQRSEMSPPTFPGHPQLRKNKYRPLSIPSPSPPPILLTVSEPVRLKGEPIPHETMEQTNTVIHKRGPPPSQAGGPTVLPPHPPLFSRNTAESVMGANLRGNRTVPVQDMEDHGMITITIAGDNKGATMDLKLVGQKDQVTPNTGHHTQKKKEEAHVEEDGHESSKNEPVPHHKPVSAVVNSNVQSVNNSIVLGCHCDDNSPGVHLTLTGHKPNFKPRRGMKHELEHKEEHVSGLSSPEGHWTLAAP